MKINIKLCVSVTIMLVAGYILCNTSWICDGPEGAETQYPNPINAPCANPRKIHQEEVGDIHEAGRRFESYEPHAGQPEYVERVEKSYPYRSSAPRHPHAPHAPAPYFEAEVDQDEDMHINMDASEDETDIAMDVREDDMDVQEDAD